MTTGKPPLTLVQPDATGVPPGAQPPRPLGHHGRAVWDRVQAEYAITDSGGIELLAQICGAVDRCEAIREQIDANGEAIKSRSGITPHPLLRQETQLRSFIARSLSRLGITTEPLARNPGRPGFNLNWVP